MSKPGPRPIPPAERLERFVQPGPPGDCWPFSGYRDASGYGRLTVARRPVPAHRVAWEAANGPIPPGAHVLHRCDNPPCCNPAHLFLGDHRANMADAAGKGRMQGGTSTGERNGRAKLSDIQVEEIRGAYARGESQRSLADRFGVTQPAVSSIVNGRTRRVL